jgi:hypothetical protein
MKDFKKRAKCWCDGDGRHAACELCRPTREDKQKIRGGVRSRLKKEIKKMLNKAKVISDSTDK